MDIGDSMDGGSFAKLVTYRLGDGANIPFWSARSISHATLKEFFPVLYVASNKKQDVVRDMEAWEGKSGNGGCALIT